MAMTSTKPNGSNNHGDYDDDNDDGYEDDD